LPEVTSVVDNHASISPTVGMGIAITP